MKYELNTLITGLVIGWLTLTIGYLAYRVIKRRWHWERYGSQLDHGKWLYDFSRQVNEVKGIAELESLLVEEIPHKIAVCRASLLVSSLWPPVTFVNDEFSLPVNHAAIRWVAAAGDLPRPACGTCFDGGSCAIEQYQIFYSEETAFNLGLEYFDF